MARKKLPISLHLLNYEMRQLIKSSPHNWYLSIFRIYISLHVLYKFFSLLLYNELLFGVDSFAPIIADPHLNIIGIEFLVENHSYFLLLGIGLCLCMLVGVGKQLTVFFVFILVEVFQRLNSMVLNGGDNLLKFLLLYLCFADSFRHYTLNKHNQKESATQNLLTNLATFSIKFHLMIIYFLSGIHKVHSKVWFSGVATYYIFALERFQGTELNKYIVQSGIFVTVSTYLTMLWELFFPFLVTNRKTKIATLVIGIFLHLGIFIFMMIYDFEILFVACYGFFFTDTELLQFKKYITSQFFRISNRFLPSIKKSPNE
jgi:hypothetical protein